MPSIRIECFGSVLHQCLFFLLLLGFFGGQPRLFCGLLLLDYASFGLDVNGSVICTEKHRSMHSPPTACSSAASVPLRIFCSEKTAWGLGATGSMLCIDVAKSWVAKTWGEIGMSLSRCKEFACSRRAGDPTTPSSLLAARAPCAPGSSRALLGAGPPGRSHAGSQVTDRRQRTARNRRNQPGSKRAITGGLRETIFSRQ